MTDVVTPQIASICEWPPIQHTPRNETDNNVKPRTEKPRNNAANRMILFIFAHLPFAKVRLKQIQTNRSHDQLDVSRAAAKIPTFHPIRHLHLKLLEALPWRDSEIPMNRGRSYGDSILAMIW